VIPVVYTLMDDLEHRLVQGWRALQNRLQKKSH